MPRAQVDGDKYMGMISIRDVVRLACRPRPRSKAAPVHVSGQHWWGPLTSPAAQVATMVDEHQEEVGRLHEYIQGSY